MKDYIAWIAPLAAAALVFCFDFYSTKHKVDEALKGYDLRVEIIDTNQRKIESLEQRLQAIELRVDSFSLNCCHDAHSDLRPSQGHNLWPLLNIRTCSLCSSLYPPWP